MNKIQFTLREDEVKLMKNMLIGFGSAQKAYLDDNNTDLFHGIIDKLNQALELCNSDDS